MHLNKNQTGLVLGSFFAVCHLIWSITIAIGIAKPLTDWVLALHNIEFSWSVTPFSILTTIILVVVTFIFGYIFGWIFAYLWNKFVK